MQNLIGQSLGRYHILEQLGEGGMATVYKAFDTRLERDVAVKVIRTDQFAPAILDRILKRFDREAKALAKLSHANIVGVIDYGEYEGMPYLVMEYLPGGTLKEYLGKPIEWQEVVRLLLPIARALDYAHRQGMVHRDVKPSNILITADGDPVLTDFGITKILDAGEGNTLTSTGMGIGTPEYMAPEQWLGKADARSDIYALGIIFFEMLSGSKVYTADTPVAVLLKQSTDPLPSVRELVHDLPEQIERILSKALAKKPEDRYGDMAGFITALEQLLPGNTGTVQRVTKPEGTAALISEMNTQSTVMQDATGEGMSRDDGRASSAIPSRQVAVSSPYRPTQKRRLWPWLLGLGGIASLVCGAFVVLLLLFVPQNLPFILDSLSGLQTPSPSQVLSPEPMAGLAGDWYDQYEDTTHTITWDGSNYSVTSFNEVRGHYDITEQVWNGSTFTWIYYVAESDVSVTIEAYEISGDEMFLNWWSTNGNSGQDTFYRR